MLPLSKINDELNALIAISKAEGICLSEANKNIHEDFLSFFNSNGYIMNIEAACKRYEKRIQNCPQDKSLFPPFRYPLHIDLAELQKITGKFIFQLLVNEPNIACSIIHNVIYTYIHSKLLMDDFQPQQLELPLRIKSLNCLTVSDISHIPLGILTVIEGTLLSVSTPSKYIRSYVVKCPASSCFNSKGQRVSGTLPAQMPACYICGETMQEAPEACEMGEQISSLFVELPEFHSLNSHAICRQTILVCFQDELIKGLEPGLEYEIVGQKGIKYFHAWSVYMKYHMVKEINSHLIPASIRKLQQDVEVLCPNSPWAFVGSLASQMAAVDHPGCCYFNLKMGLLISLATQGPGMKPMPILAVGTDTHVAHRLMRKCAAIRKRGAPLEWGSSLPSGQLHWDSHGSDGHGWVEAGPLLLAAGGVCCLGDWAKLKGKAVQTVLSVLESGYVSLESQSTSNIPSYTFPLRSSVWTYLLWTRNRKISSLSNLKSLIQIFGIPFLATDEKNSEQMIYHTLLQHMKPSIPSFCHVSTNDFMEYLNLVTLREVKITSAASQLIQKYFVASRRAQPEHLPVNAVSIITTLSEAYARLAMQDEVQPEHVFVVLQLYEETLLYIYGSSVISSPAPSVLASGKSIPQWVHQTLQEFASWMEDFIHTFVGNISQIC